MYLFYIKSPKKEEEKANNKASFEGLSVIFSIIRKTFILKKLTFVLKCLKKKIQLH